METIDGSKGAQGDIVCRCSMVCISNGYLGLGGCQMAKGIKKGKWMAKEPRYLSGKGVVFMEKAC